MSDKRPEKASTMSVEYVTEAKGMADFILSKVHRGPGDTVEAAMYRAERVFGAPANWLHRLRYREVRDMPVSAFASLVMAYRAACEAGERAYQAERELADARNSKLVRLADFVAGKKAQEALNDQEGGE
jgi:hypothetical protein